MIFQKTKRVRLTGRKLSELNSEIHERDGNKCCLCGRWVDLGEKFHHEPGGANKQDRVECGATACGECHHERHFGFNPGEWKRRIEAYLRELYPAYWEG